MPDSPTLRRVHLLDIGRILLGLVLLVAGGELLVRGAAGLAARIGMSPLVVGLTVVAFATSAPELAVTLGAVLGGEPGLAVGNVVGSNIANVLMILGTAAVILPLLVKVQLVRVDIPFMATFSVLFLLLAGDGGLSRVDGLILFVLLALYISVAIILSRRDGQADDLHGPGASIATASAGRVSRTVGDNADTMTEAAREVDAKGGSIGRDLLFLLIGVGLLIVGANILVRGATGIATAFGVSDLIVGLTVVAVGTSLPELATSIVAVRRGQRDLAVGNVVGSNIFNIGAVAGLAGIISPTGLPVPESALALDIPLMIAASVVLLPLAFTGSVIRRWEGALLLGLYIAYLIYTVLAAGERPELQGFTTVMMWFVSPLLVLTLVSAVAYEIGRRRSSTAQAR
jgi:cation:H+ antiporter